MPPLSAPLPGSFGAPTPMGTSSWVLFLVGYRSPRGLVLPYTTAVRGAVGGGFYASSCAGRARADHGRVVDHPRADASPQRPHPRPRRGALGHQVCLGHTTVAALGGVHLTHRLVDAASVTEVRRGRRRTRTPRTVTDEWAIEGRPIVIHLPGGWRKSIPPPPPPRPNELDLLAIGAAAGLPFTTWS